MKHKVVGVLSLALVLFASPALSALDCPVCFKNLTPLPGRRTLSDGSRAINVAIRTGNGPDSWAIGGDVNTPDPNVAVATAGAMNLWNDARDLGSASGRTNSVYRLESPSNPTNLTTDILIVKAPLNFQHPGFMDVKTGPPYKLHIREDMLYRMDPADLQALIAHEIGHRLGLANSNLGGGTCDADGPTIMRGLTEDPARPGPPSMIIADKKTVTASDVVQVNRFFQNRDANCTITHTGITASNCADFDEDGVSSCDGDCNDLDPFSATDCAECADVDEDGVSTCAGDCNDFDPFSAADCSGGGGGTCAFQMTEDPWLMGNDCDICWDGEDNDCDGLKDGQEPSCWNRCNSPVLVDTDGDGFSLTSAAEGVLFDFDGDGTPERLSWTSANADDAWLALDRNGNGVVDSARELFGNLTPQPAPPQGEMKNGFLALAEYDKPANGGDGDGAIDSSDIIFRALRLWQDRNHNGVSEPGELSTLPSLSVARLRLDYKESKRTDEHGNRFAYKVKVEDAKGAKVGRWAWDVFLLRGQ